MYILHYYQNEFYKIINLLSKIVIISPFLTSQIDSSFVRQYYNMHFNGIDEGLFKIKGTFLLDLSN